MRKSLVALAAAVVLPLSALAVPASAAPSPNAPLMINDSECHEEGTQTVCSSSRGSLQLLFTKSGVEQFRFSIRDSFSVTDTATGALVASYGLTGRTQSLTRDGEIRVLRNRNVQTETVAGETCSATFTFKFTNGKFQRDTFETDCTAA